MTISVISYRSIGQEGSDTFGNPKDIELQRNISETIESVRSALCRSESEGANRTPLRSSPPLPFSQYQSQAPFDDASTQAAFSTQLPAQVHDQVTVSQPQDRAALLLSLLHNKAGVPKENPTPYANSASPVRHVIPSNFMRKHSSAGSEVQASPQPSELPALQDNAMKPSAAYDIGRSEPLVSVVGHATEEVEDAGSHSVVLQPVTYGNDREVEAHTSVVNGDADPGESGTAVMTTARSEWRRIRQLPERNIFEGLKRIPRSYVRITKDQKQLLDEDDSWVHFGDASKSSRLNLPPKILDQLMRSSRPQNKNHDENADDKSVETDPEEEGADSQSSDDSVQDGQAEPEFGETSSIDVVQSAGAALKASSSIMHEPEHDSSCLKSPQRGHPEPKLPQASTPIPTQGPARNERSPWSLSPVEHLQPISRQEAHQNPIASSRHPKSPSTLVQETSSLAEPELPPVRRSEVRNHQNTDTEGSESTDSNKVKHASSDTERPQYRSTAATIPQSSETTSDEEDMELVVPNAIDDPFEQVDADMAGAHHNTSSAPEQQITTVQVQQTPFGGQLQGTVRRRLFGPTGRDLGSVPKREIKDIFSDPIIPSTFVDMTTTFAESSAPSAIKYTSNNIITSQNISSEHSSRHPSSIHEEAKKERNDTSPSPVTSLAREERAGSSWGDVVPRTQPLQSPSEASLEDSVPESTNRLASTSGRTNRLLSSQAKSDIDQSNEDIICFSKSNRWEPLQETALSECKPENYETGYSSSDTAWNKRSREDESSSEKPLKRRRIIKAREFHFSLHEESPRDPSEMAKVNRLNFIRGLPSESDQDKLVWSSPSRSKTQIKESTPATPLEGDQQSAEMSTTVTLDEVKEESQVSSNPRQEGSDNRLTIQPRENEINELQTRPRSVSEDSRRAQEINLFEKYMQTYPTFTQTKRAILKACVYLEWLVGKKKAPHPYLWDDFIRAFSTEYTDYIRSLSGPEKSTGLSGIEFYNTRVSSPIFLSQVITPENFRATFSMFPEQTAQLRSMFRNESFARRQTPSSTIQRQDVTSQVGRTDAEANEPGRQVNEPKHQVNESDRQVNESGNQTDERVATPKKPFFETPSQLRGDGEKRLQSSPPASSRKLPWSSLRTETPVKSGNGKNEDTMPQIYSQKRKNEERRNSEGENHETSRSVEAQPSLSKVKETVQVKIKPRRTESMPHPDALKGSTSLVIDKKHRQSISGINQTASNHNNAWSGSKQLAPEIRKEIASWRSFLGSGKYKRRRSSVLSQSTISSPTPETGSNGRHSHISVVEKRQAEPETQAWDYE